MESLTRDNDDYRNEYMLQETKKDNAKCNTKEDIVFKCPEIHFPPIEESLHRINEITTEGHGDMTIEFYEDGRVYILTSIASTLKRVYWNKLTINYRPSIYVHILGNTDDGSGTIMQMQDFYFSLWGDSQREKIIPSNSTKEEIDLAKEEFIKEYEERKYGDNFHRFQKWLVRGTEIKFINKKNTGQLIIYNRTFHMKVITTQFGSNIMIPPYHKYNAENNRCSLCKK